jgi:hypothetical protein
MRTPSSGRAVARFLLLGSDMNTKRILVIDPQPDRDLFAGLARTNGHQFTFVSGYLQSVAESIRVRPHVIYVRRDLPWLQGALPLDFLFNGIEVVFFTPEELRGDLPSRNMHRAPAP